MKQTVRYHTLDAWLRARHGEKVQKIPLDAGASCPNRDGTLGVSGCSFCNATGSGSGLGGRSLAEQWAYWRNRFGVSDRLKHTRLFLGYLQAFTNTYGPAERLTRILDDLAALPGLIGVCVGTRPDCVDEEKMALLAARPWPELWLELGVQSRHDATLARIRRGHDAEASERAIRLAAARGIKVCAHLMAGLPGETDEDFLETVRWIAALPVDGVKLHGLYVCRGTPLEEEWKAGLYQPGTQDAYVELAARALTLLPSRVIIHRLTGDPAPGELAAPDWAPQKGQTIRKLDALLEGRDWWQGMKADAPCGNPWADPRSPAQDARRNGRR
ncbi:MAG: TIGR01212 family radical SAM protein [Desulfovibrionaceae bacterium]|nr:TIGR01212 family radical SAM protein [Desulfovibrionaceae bacterium]